MKKILIIMTALTVSALPLAMAQTKDKVDKTMTDRQTTQTMDEYGNVQEKETTESTSVTQKDDESSTISKGGLFLEPMILGSQENTSIQSSQLPLISDDTSGTSRGYGVGLRFGGHVSEIILIGVDGRYTKNRMQDSFYQDADADVYNIAPMIGLQTPLFGIRVLAGYVLAGENNPGAGIQGFDLKFKEASGWRLGAGIHVGPVSINAEYQDLKYNTTEIESWGSVAINNDTSVDSTTQGYILSVGFPVEF